MSSLFGRLGAYIESANTVPIESIEEIRSGDDARYAREHFQLADEYQDRWLTIIYILDGRYKTLHLIARNVGTFQMWDRTLRTLHGIRKDLMRGLGNGEIRQALWEKQYWKTADEGPDQKATFTEVEGLCKKLNYNTNRDDLERLFKVCVYSTSFLVFLKCYLSAASRQVTTWLP